jgi:hypothetical protein
MDFSAVRPTIGLKYLVRASSKRVCEIVGPGPVRGLPSRTQGID